MKGSRRPLLPHLDVYAAEHRPRLTIYKRYANTLHSTLASTFSNSRSARRPPTRHRRTHLSLFSSLPPGSTPMSPPTRRSAKKAITENEGSRRESKKSHLFSAPPRRYSSPSISCRFTVSSTLAHLAPNPALFGDTPSPYTVFAPSTHPTHLRCCQPENYRRRAPCPCASATAADPGQRLAEQLYKAFGWAEASMFEGMRSHFPPRKILADAFEFKQSFSNASRALPKKNFPMPMIWYPLARRTRSGAEFSAFSLPANITALKELSFDFAPLVKRAVIAEREDQEDHEDEDESNVIDEDSVLHDSSGVDDESESLPPTNPLDDIDDEYPAPAPPRPERRRRSPSFKEVVASSNRPHKGPHRRRAPETAKAAQVKAAKKAAAAHARRKKRREKAKIEIGHVATASTIQTYVWPAQPLQTSLATSTLPTTLGAYSAKLENATEKAGSRICRSLEEFISNGFSIIHWDGITPRPLVDRHGRIVAVLAGQPNKDDYRIATAQAFQAIQRAGSETRFPASMKHHRRGLFAAINVGLSYGNGQTAPTWLNNKKYNGLADSLLADPSIERMAGFADFAFSLWAPSLYKYYRAQDSKLRKYHPDLRRPFNSSVFYCTAFNFARNVWTFKHRDVLNLAFGWCAVQALGRFDHTKGGHLVLWDLKLVVEFPHGALILLPSATIAHSNVPVQPGDERVSFTQFSAGGIFRYIDNHGKTEKKLAADDPEEYSHLMKLKEQRWEMGLALLSTMDELTSEL
ncbi:hypothetical protein R3P38DRAFT_3196032 [Favolaschia claudopus]|uniref:Uncharacterized protein n=1 Tax=Favolaschia claudopus TaxID=2862362 RepID=A0AAW0BCQ7_9AGAR